MYRLTELALRNKSIVLLLSFALFLSGVMAWGSLQQELLPDIELPFVTVIAALPGAGAEDVAQQVTDPGRAGHQERAAPGEAVRRPRPTRCRWSSPSSSTARTSRTPGPRSRRPSGPRPCPRASTPRVSALNINDQPVIVAAVGPAQGADPAAAAVIARDGAAADDQGHPRRVIGRPHRGDHPAPGHHPRPGEDGRRRRLSPAGPGPAPGQPADRSCGQPHRRPDAAARDRGPSLPRRSRSSRARSSPSSSRPPPAARRRR